MPSAFWPALLLAIISVCAKVALVWSLMPQKEAWLRLLAITASDLLFAMVYGLISWGLIRMSRRRPGIRKAIWTGIITFGALAGLYAVANVGIVNALGVPLNVRMFGLISRVTDLQSSIAAHCSRGLIVGMIFALAAFVLVGWVGRRLRIGRVMLIAVVSVGVAWVALGTTLRAQSPPGSFARAAGRNPHWEMLGSLVSLTQSQRLELVREFPPEFAQDFALAGAFDRPSLPQHSIPVKNVILIVLESVSAQYMSLYGAPYDTTPNLIRESRHALVVDRAYANAGYTYRSVVPIVYGVHPGLPWGWLPSDEFQMPKGMSGMLRDRGSRTALLTAANPEWGGMDWMSQEAGAQEVIGPIQLGGPRASSWGTEDRALIDGLLRWIDQKPGQPFFAIAWTDQTHDPYTLEAGTKPIQFVDPKTMRKGVWLNNYLTAIRQVDHHLGRLLDELRKRGLADDTLVVITADHGEAFGTPHEAYGHGGALYDECMRVPMVFWNPRMFPGGQRVEGAAGHVDLNPTIAHLLNMSPHPTWQGASIFSPQHPGRVYFTIDLSGYQFGVAERNWKYILRANEGFEELYDLKEDPRELRNLAGSRTEQTREFRARISAFIRSEELFLKGPLARPGAAQR